MAGHVVAVSVARPQWAEMYGRQVFSSIVREAATGPVHFASGGPADNQTAVHTEEVFAFFAEHYDHWSAELGIAREAWTPCYWGENLMLAGMPDEGELRVGDRYRIGEALLEITSPRIPCFKLSWRLGQPESFLKPLIASGRMGCYMRVIEPGRISAGDRARMVAHPNEAISVLALSQLLHDPDIADLDVLRRVLATTGLGGQAAGMVRKRIAFLTDGRLPVKGRWTGWRNFRITAITQETRNIKSLRLRPADSGPIGGYRAGQFLAIRLPETAGRAVRSWSLSDYDQDGDSYRISIKREPQGEASRWVHDQAAIGDMLDVRPPSGRFALDRSGFLRTVLISAGIGVTPMVAMLQAHAERGEEAPPLLWVHAARSGQDHAHSAQVDAVLATMPRAVRRVFYSAPAEDDDLGHRHDRIGRLDAAAIAEIVAESYALSPFGRLIELPGEHSDVYLCGPPEFEDDVRRALEAEGVAPAAIRSERFSAGGAAGPAEPAAPEEAEVRLIGSDSCLTWRRDDDLTLLELIEAQGIAVDSGCRMGTCGTCEASLREGAVRYLFSPAAEPAAGKVLLCCSQPASARLVIVLSEG